MSNWIALTKQNAVSCAATLTGNGPGQALIGRCISWLQILQGVGSGGDVASSGEGVVLRKLAQRAHVRHVTIFDVGANQGQFLSEVVHQFGESPYFVHSFEPGTGAFQVLRTKFHRLGNVTLNHKAVSNMSGTATLWFDAEGSAGASLSKRDLSHLGREFSSQESVATITIDKYCQDNSIDFVDLLKIDVEGHELDVLNGAHQAFESRRVGMVLFEFGGCNVDSRCFFRDLWEFFRGVDMQVGRLTPSGYVVPLLRYSEVLEQYRTTNYVVTRHR